ncbi:hypothetical protein H9638_16645 [Arthrobacter sp. Sa2BUA2]|uniref:Uncharacterized protein n=1 Tax=Arthrobacter pullicola TaxID=2762224 RepID=A0ABR8YMF5_9MICC|nr:hypothetical protein [Arthrobacter pullicola]MBD8045436.1 hypothetical protein [Arthrobacter pullicola]
MRTRLLDETKYPTTKYRNISDFCSADSLPNGYLTFDHQGLPIDLLNRASGAETTIVVFHAALTPKVETLPYFAGQTVTKDAPANRLWIQDPSLYLDDRLLLSWFAGNKRQPELQSTLVSVLQKVVEAHGSKRVIFFGASGGGFAALYYSRFFPGSLAIAINPQTNLAAYNWKAIEEYGHFAFGIDGNESLDHLLNNRIVSNLRDHYVGATNSIAYMQNVNDETHVGPHYQPFIESLPETCHAQVLFGDWGPGHTAPEKEEINNVIVTAVRSRGDWCKLSAVGFRRPEISTSTSATHGAAPNICRLRLVMRRVKRRLVEYFKLQRP